MLQGSLQYQEVSLHSLEKTSPAIPGSYNNNKLWEIPAFCQIPYFAGMAV